MSPAAVPAWKSFGGQRSFILLDSMLEGTYDMRSVTVLITHITIEGPQHLCTAVEDVVVRIDATIYYVNIRLRSE